MVVDAERRQPVDLVAPQVDAHGCLGGGRKDVDDRPAPSELAAVLDELLTTIAEVDEPVGELVGIDDRSVADRDRLDGQRLGTEPLEQGTHAGDDDLRSTLGVAEPPEHLEAATHRLDGRAQPLERQRLPRRQHGDVIRHLDELAEIVGQLAGHRARRGGDEQRTVVRQPGEGGDGHRAGDLADRQPRPRVAEGAREPRLIAQQRGEISQSHGASRVPARAVSF